MNLKPTLLFTAFLLSGAPAVAQLNGAYFIPDATYPSIASAINALNASGVSGAVTLNVAAGYTETAPAGGFLLGSATLNASLSAVNTLTIIKAGTGANPLITANTGASTTTDGIFTIAGVDNLTINGIDLAESAANTTATTAMEWGYAFVNRNAAAPFDGCNNNTIRNCAITLNRSIATGSKGIYMAHTTAASTTALTITAPADTHSGNKFYSNSISNCIIPIYILGFDDVAPYTLYDQNNDIGGSVAGTGNSLTNFGATTGFITYGVYFIYNHNGNLSNNTIDMLAGGGPNGGLGTYGAYLYGINSTFTINSNSVNLGIAQTASGAFYGLYGNAAGTNITLSGNRITLTEGSGLAATACTGAYFPNALIFTATGNRVTQSQALSTPTYGIYTSATSTVIMNTDTITQVTTAPVNAPFYQLLSSGNALSETVNNNVFLNSSIATNGASGLVSLIYTANNTANKTITGNRISGTFTHTSTVTSGATIFVEDNTPGAVAGGTANISGNNFSNVNVTGSPLYGIYYSASAGSTQAFALNSDTLSNITGTTGSLYGMYLISGNTGTVNSNLINNLTTGNTVATTGIYDAGTNIVSASINKNKIYDLQGGAVGGITVTGGTTTHIANNIIGNLTAPAGNGTSDAVVGINLVTAQANSSINVYYNTVYLNAASTGANFSTSALYHTANATATSATLDLRNNILVNNSTANGTGNTAAFRSSGAALANLAATSDRNLLYAGTPGVSNLLYTDGANAYQSQTDYRAGLAPAESHSVTENPAFASTTGASAAFLHFAPGTATLAESRAANIAGYTDDFDGNIRQGNPGYTGNGTAPDIGATENNYVPVNPLAITLNTFTGRQAGAVNELSWVTLNELSTDGFELERSATGSDFNRIATIAAKGAASDYSYADAAPLTGHNYYRLKMLQASGKATYSHTILLDATTGRGGLSFFPNPVRDVMTLQLPGEGHGATVQILDGTGRQLQELTATGSTLRINMSSYPAGHYFIRCIAGNEVQAQPFDKQ